MELTPSDLAGVRDIEIFIGYDLNYIRQGAYSSVAGAHQTCGH